MGEDLKAFEDVDRRIKQFAVELVCGVDKSLDDKFAMAGAQNATQNATESVEGATVEAPVTVDVPVEEAAAAEGEGAATEGEAVAAEGEALPAEGQ